MAKWRQSPPRASTALVWITGYATHRNTSSVSRLPTIHSASNLERPVRIFAAFEDSTVLALVLVELALAFFPHGRSKADADQ
jgi:hypothetical protein